MKANSRALIWMMALAAFITGGSALAEDRFPSRPVTIVVPYPAGGTSDVQLRMIQENLQKALGQAVVIDNRPGASGGIAAGLVARAAPDGYTLLYPNNGVVITPLLIPKIGFDALKDFKPVGTVTSVPMVLVANNSVPASNVQELIKYAKQQPNGLMYASAGTGSYGHLASTRFSSMAGIKLTHIPYKGEAGTTMAVRTGEVQLLMTTPSGTMLSLVKSGQIKMLGVATSQPSPLVPGAEPLVKSVPGFTAEVWFGLLAPAGTPDAIVARINAAVKQALDDPEVNHKLLASGAMAKTSTPQELGAMMKTESALWTDIIRQYDIKAE
jgi:tripartite-type tricarboxylate transporter receptor subunit TctC